MVLKIKAAGDSKLNDSPLAGYKLVMQCFPVIKHEISHSSPVHFPGINPLTPT